MTRRSHAVPSVVASGRTSGALRVLTQRPEFFSEPPTSATGRRNSAAGRAGSASGRGRLSGEQRADDRAEHAAVGKILGRAPGRAGEPRYRARDSVRRPA